MDKIIKKTLKMIESEGYEAYLVGGFVRDFLSGRINYDVDICTNALPKDLLKIFPNAISNEYGGLNFRLSKYNFDVTTYREEKKYDGRKPVKIEYVSSLLIDIKRRDFTINAICMDKNENVIDLLAGRHDLEDGVIKSIGDADQKFKEDPLRMIRAIRFASIFNYKIEEVTLKSIKNNYLLIEFVSSEKIKEEITKILSNCNYKYGLSLLKETHIDRVIGLSYGDIVYTDDVLGMYCQINIEKIQFSKTQLDNIKKLKSILNIKKIDNHELFTYGLYICTVAGDILGYTKEELSKKYNNLPIKSMKDICIDGIEIIDLLKVEPSKLISDIINDVKNQILNGSIVNKKSAIKKYIVEKYYE